MLLTTLSLQLILLMRFEFTICAFDYMDHLKIFESYRSPLAGHRKNWIEAKYYIQKNFERFALIVKNQEFQTEMASLDNSIVKISGTNIIGTSQSSSNDDPVIVVGANYDSSLQWNPLMENGASMTALLALVGEFQNRKENEFFIQNTTILFVAFDINVKSHVPMGPGDSGADYFVNDYLMKYLDGKKFLGAVILDSISNYNLENSSQILIEGFNQVFPSVYDELIFSGKKADFLGLVTRDGQKNTKFAHHFATVYRKLSSRHPFHLEELVVSDGVPVYPYLHGSINRRSQIPFWKKELPAFLLTDMDISRLPSDGDSCKKFCKIETFWNDERRQFVQATTRAILNMLLQFQTLVKNNNSDDQKDDFRSEEDLFGETNQPEMSLSSSETNNSSQMSICEIIVIMSFFIFTYNLKLRVLSNL